MLDPLSDAKAAYKHGKKAWKAGKNARRANRIKSRHNDDSAGWMSPMVRAREVRALRDAKNASSDKGRSQRGLLWSIKMGLRGNLKDSRRRVLERQVDQTTAIPGRAGGQKPTDMSCWVTSHTTWRAHMRASATVRRRERRPVV